MYNLLTTSSILISLIGLCLIVYFLYRAWRKTDYAQHPEEYATKGSTGERLVYLNLVRGYNIPEEQIFRNVYVPTRNGTTEIDLIVVSKKGLLVFECKNYAGKIYGDGHRRRWIQYVGRKKSFFLSPLLQNKHHEQALRRYFAEITDLPIITFVTTTSNAEWRLRNLRPDDYVLGRKDGELGEIYERLPSAQCMTRYFKTICMRLRQLERPDEKIREEHVERIRRKYHK